MEFVIGDSIAIQRAPLILAHDALRGDVRPDVILTDIGLPGMSGIEASRVAFENTRIQAIVSRQRS